MDKYIGLVIGIENYHDVKKLGKVRYAIDDAKVFRNTLINLGCDPDKIELIPNEQATKATILEKVKRVVKAATAHETIIFFYAGHGFYHNGENLISCVDTLLSSLSDTTVNLNTILSQFDTAKSNKVIAFLDCCHSGIEFSQQERSPASNFAVDELKYQYKDAEHLTVFASCKSDEKSQSDLDRKHGAWSYYLIQALQGKADTNVYEGTLLFSNNLQKYLLEKTFERVKQITVEKKNQTPIKFGKETTDKFIVADLSKVFEERESKIKTAGVRLERATILATEEDWVRNLPGFNKEKGHKAPKEISSYHESWIKKIAQKLIEDELNEVGDSLRNKLGYKRKQIEAPLVEDGVGQLSTIDFDYIVSIEQSKSEAETYILTRSIANFKNSDILTRPEFNEVFKNTFNEIEFVLVGDLDVESVIDRIEDIDDEENISVEYEHTDTTKCKVYIKGLSGYISLTERAFKLVSSNKNSPEKLILSFKQAYQMIEQNKIPKMLL